LKGDEFANSGENIEVFQIMPGKLPGHKKSPHRGAEIGINDDYVPAQNPAGAAPDGDFFIGQALIPDRDPELQRDFFQLLQEKIIRKRMIHFPSPRSDGIIDKIIAKSKMLSPPYFLNDFRHFL
jgi:hypothetical protein